MIVVITTEEKIETTTEGTMIDTTIEDLAMKIIAAEIIKDTHETDLEVTVIEKINKERQNNEL